LSDAGGVNSDESLHLLFSFSCSAEKEAKMERETRKNMQTFFFPLFPLFVRAYLSLPPYTLLLYDP
jgi:hypothetical protein